VLTSVRKKYPQIFFKNKEKIKKAKKFDDFLKDNIELAREKKI